MENGSQKAASPWSRIDSFMANILSLGEKSKDSNGIPEKASQNEIVPMKHTKRTTIIPSSSSAHDLRCSDMEKDRQDESSPRGVLEGCLRDPDSDTASPSSSSDNSTTLHLVCTTSRAIANWSKFFKLWKKKSIKRLVSFPSMPKISRRRSRSIREDPELTHIFNYKSSLKQFKVSEVEEATDNFSNENLIGKGSYATVYKGRLRDGQLVAVKRLTKGTIHERTNGFLTEVGIIAYVDHPNTAKLIGCDGDGQHLVFELSRLGSLGSLLHGPRDILDWSKRFKIAVGTANGLTYLHEHCQKRIIHRDIKTDNILLTEDFEPQICDFGLAKWLPRHWTHYNASKFEGTFGYLAPEYFMHGIVDEKTDVYAFGVLLLELITGRPALDDSQQNVVIWAKPFIDNNDIKELVDPSLGDNYDLEEMDRTILTASLCIDQSPHLRPRMSQAVVLLRGNEYVIQCAKECQMKTLQRTYSEELLDVLEYNSTRYLSEMNRHKEVALGS